VRYLSAISSACSLFIGKGSIHQLRACVTPCTSDFVRFYVYVFCIY
jgi:hypothetical protein